MGNAYDVDFPQELQFLGTLSHAAENLRIQNCTRLCFGVLFVDHYAVYPELWDRSQTTWSQKDWQLKRYF